jgi:hypothetical protein
MDLEERLARVEAILDEEISARARADHGLEDRISYMEGICLRPMLARRINGPIPWLWKLLGLQWRPPKVQ